jgi:hypothetical protein
MRDGEKALAVTRSDAGKFMEASAGCRVETHRSVKLGTDCRLDADGASGFVLAYLDQVLHVSLFAKAAVSFLKIVPPIYLDIIVVIFYDVVQLDNTIYLDNNGQ